MFVITREMKMICFSFATFKGYISEQYELSMPEDNSLTIDQEYLPDVIGSLREIKTAKEIEILKQAVAMSAIGQVEVMKAIHPNISERELQGIHEFIFKKYGKACWLPLNCWGRGTWMCTSLHCKHCRSGGNQLVLMDVGTEFQNYTADVTRTIPANGKFTKEQAEIYNLVLAAQNAGIEASVVGASFSTPIESLDRLFNKDLLILELSSLKKKFAPIFLMEHLIILVSMCMTLAPMDLFEPTLSYC